MEDIHSTQRTSQSPFASQNHSMNVNMVGLNPNISSRPDFFPTSSSSAQDRRGSDENMHMNTSPQIPVSPIQQQQFSSQQQQFSSQQRIQVSGLASNPSQPQQQDNIIPGANRFKRSRPSEDNQPNLSTFDANRTSEFWHLWNQHQQNQQPPPPLFTQPTSHQPMQPLQHIQQQLHQQHQHQPMHHQTQSLQQSSNSMFMRVDSQEGSLQRNRPEGATGMEDEMGWNPTGTLSSVELLQILQPAVGVDQLLFKTESAETLMINSVNGHQQTANTGVMNSHASHAPLGPGSANHSGEAMPDPSILQPSGLPSANLFFGSANRSNPGSAEYVPRSANSSNELFQRITGGSNEFLSRLPTSPDFLRSNPGSAELLPKVSPGPVSADLLPRTGGSSDFITRSNPGSADFITRSNPGSADFLARSSPGSADYVVKSNPGSGEYIQRSPAISANSSAEGLPSLNQVSQTTRKQIEDVHDLVTKISAELKRLRVDQKQVPLPLPNDAAERINSAHNQIRGALSWAEKHLVNLLDHFKLEPEEMHLLLQMQQDLFFWSRQLELYAQELQIMHAGGSTPCFGLVISTQPFPNSVKQNKSIDEPMGVHLITGAKFDTKPRVIVKAEVIEASSAGSKKKKSSIGLENAEKPINDIGVAMFNDLKFPQGTRLNIIRLKFTCTFALNDMQGKHHNYMLESNSSNPIVVKTNENQWYEAEGLLLDSMIFNAGAEVSWAKFCNWLQRRYLGATRQSLQTPVRPLTSYELQYLRKVKFENQTTISQEDFNQFWLW
eukprot:TRINITY_DN2406_c0_g1_i2.p1 TRINITY_DN2406_c0_g1~~TRINITY_DN2406_c0_g1_i2.p1  ORF type:complete len:779 (+),score=200.03 TRINITY_DN2406_c0_g1_i2:287-2623(+)